MPVITIVDPSKITANLTGSPIQTIHEETTVIPASTNNSEPTPNADNTGF